MVFLAPHDILHLSRNDGECGKTSPVKRGPGRPRKRKNCGNQKANANDEDPASGGNSPCPERPGSAVSSIEPVLPAHQGSETDEPIESLMSKAEVTSPVALMNKEEENVSQTTVSKSEVKRHLEVDFLHIILQVTFRLTIRNTNGRP